MGTFKLTEEQQQFKDYVDSVLTDNWDKVTPLCSSREAYLYAVKLQHIIRDTHRSSEGGRYLTSTESLINTFTKYAVSLLHFLGVSKDDFVNILVSKNVNYGNSFDQVVDMYGMVGMFIRFEDKVNRLHQLEKNGVDDLVGEAIDDTLLDIAGYAVLSVNYLKTNKLS